MGTWTCPDCKRRFGRTNQSHGCAPAMTAANYFATRPDGDRKIYEAVARYVEQLGEVVIDFVSVGVLVKRERTFAELRPNRRGMSLCFILSRTEDDERIARTIKLSANRTAHLVDLAGPREVDRQVKGWLAEAYASSPTTRPGR